MKARKIYTAPQQAERIFTDREEPRRAFWAAYDRVNAEPGSVEAVSYYGVGGIGKTSLLLQLMRELKERAAGSPGLYYSFELSGRSKDDCLCFLAESLMQCFGGLRFPLFGAALLRLNQIAGRDILDLEKRLENSFVNRSEVAAAVDVLSVVVPHFGFAKLAGRAGLKLFRTIKNSQKYRTGKNAPVYQEIDGSGAAELMNNLQKYFCMDAADFLENQSLPIVIMLDGYENLSNTLERGDLADVDDGWVWGREGLIWSLPNTLWVIAGRNRLMWDQYDGEIRDSLEQHLLGNISEPDTRGFLRLRGITEEDLYADIYRLTEGTPVYLDMCVNMYRQIKASCGADYHPTIKDFGDDPVALVERFLRGMNGEHQRIVKLISCLPASWTEDMAIDAARSVGYMETRGAFDDICRLSVVEHDGNHSKIHGALRTVVRKFMSEEERSRLDNCVLRMLLKRINDPDCRIDRVDYAAWAAELLDREDAVLSVSEEDLRTIFIAADVYNDLGNYRAFYDYTQKIREYVSARCGGEAMRAVCMHHLCRSLLYLGRYQEAVGAGREACEFMLKTYGTDHSDSLDALQNYANCCYRNGNLEKARELTQTIYEARLRVNGCDHEKTVACINNLAIYSAMLKDYTNAVEMLQLSHATMSRLLGAEHPRTVICLNNLAAVYNGLGDHGKAVEMIRQVYDIQLRTLGADHPEVLVSMFNLAVGYGDLGEYMTALNLANKAYEEHKRILGEDHPDTYSALNYLAECNLNLGNLAVARKLAKKAWEAQGALLGVDHPDTEKSRKLIEKCE